MSQPIRTNTTPGEALAVVGICFGLFIAHSIQAVVSNFPTGAFTDAGLVWTIAAELVLGLAALALLYARGYAVATLLPTLTFRGSALGIGLFFVAWIVGALFVSPFAAGQGEQPVDRMMQDTTLTLPVLVMMAMVNGTYEEIFLLGFLQRGLRGFGLSLALGVMLLVRILYHLYQGPLGAVWVFGVGLVFGLYYIRSGNLWPPVFAHMLWDIVPFVFQP